MSKYKVSGTEDPRTGEVTTWITRDNEHIDLEDVISDVLSLQSDLASLQLEKEKLAEMFRDLRECWFAKVLHQNIPERQYTSDEEYLEIRQINRTLWNKFQRQTEELITGGSHRLAPMCANDLGDNQ